MHLIALQDACEDSSLTVDDDNREAFRQVLQGYIPQVMAFLQQSWSNPQVRGSEDASVALLECFSDWIRFCRVDPVQLAQHPLLPAALEQLGVRPRFRACEEVLSRTKALLRRNRSRRAPSQTVASRRPARQLTASTPRPLCRLQRLDTSHVAR